MGEIAERNMKVVIVEDEKPAARRLQRMLDKLNIKAEVMLHSVAAAIEWFQNNEHPDLIFLDIQLSDGISFEIFDAVNIKSSVIFTTAYDQYALQAFKLNSIDYLLKPIDDDDLETALQKFQSFTPQSQNMTRAFQNIKKMLLGEIEKPYKERFTLKVGQHLKIINSNEIECFYSEHKTTYLSTNSSRNYPIEETLEQLETSLNPKIFYRVSRKFYININAIQDIIAYTNSRLKIKLTSYKEQEIIVSRERVKSFKQWLG